MTAECGSAELAFLDSLSNPVNVHAIAQTMRQQEPEERAQFVEYLKALHRRYSATSLARSKLQSCWSLYFVELLIDEDSRPCLEAAAFVSSHNRQQLLALRAGQ